MTTDKPALSTRLNQFWARMLAPINAYLGTALIALAVAIALIGLTGGHMGGHVEISVTRDGGDVSVRVQEGQMQDDRMPEDRMQKGEEYRNWHPDWRHHGYGHHGYEHHGWHHGGRGAGLFGLVLALGLAAMVGLVARLIQIEGHLAALRKGIENGSAASAASAPPAKAKQAKKAKKAKAKAKAKAAKAKTKAKSPKAKQAKKRG